MLQYLKNVLGLSAEEAAWPDQQRLPLYLRGDRAYSVLSVNGVKFLLIRMSQAKFNLSAFLKQSKKLREYWPGGVVLCFDALTSYQRKALIEKGISFIVPESQLYLPCMGMVLQERAAVPPKSVSKFSSAAQHLFLFLLYQKSADAMSKAELGRRLKLPAMNITRAVQELQALGIVRSEKAGRCDYVSPLYAGKALYQKAAPYLISPVQKRVFVGFAYEFLKLPLSGESALADRTMLSPSSVTCRAIGRREFKELERVVIVDPAWCSDEEYLELEVWKYPPQSLACDGVVDVVSLAASLSHNKDERVELAVEEMLEAYKW